MIKTQSKWLWLIGLGALAGLAIWKLTKEVSAAQANTTLTPTAQATIASIQELIATTEATAIPPIYVGTTVDPNADAHAQAVYAELAKTHPNIPVAANGMTAQQLLNIHALVPTPEQKAAGAVPLVSNYRPPRTIMLPGNTSVDVIHSYLMDPQYSNAVMLEPPIIVPTGATPIIDDSMGSWSYGKTVGISFEGLDTLTRRTRTYVVFLANQYWDVTKYFY